MASGDGRVLCGSCGLAYAWKPELAGKKVRCKCQAVMMIPAEAPAAGAAVKAQIAKPAPTAAVPSAPASKPPAPAPTPAAPQASGVRRPVVATPPPPAQSDDDIGLKLDDEEFNLKLDDDSAKLKPEAQPAKPAPAKPAAAPSSPAVANTGGTRVMAKTDAGSYDLDMPEDGIQLAPAKDEPKPAIAAAAKTPTPAKPAPAAPAKPVAPGKPVAAAAMKPAAPPPVAPANTGGSSCPSCAKPVGAAAVICISCGFNLKEGKKLTTESGGVVREAIRGTGKARRVRSDHPLGFFGKMAAGWSMAKMSYGIIWDFKQLVLFPIFSTTTSIIVLASFLLPLWGVGKMEQWSAMMDRKPESLSDVDPLLYIVAFAFYFCAYFVIVFFNTALTACTMKVTAGEVPTLGYGFSVAIKRVPQIAAWAALSAVVGVLLKLIENVHEKAGRIIAAPFGSAWTILTYFVVPVLCVEGVGPFTAVKRSVETLSDTWGAGLVANVSTALFNFVLFLPLLLLLGVGLFVAAAMQSFVVAVSVVSLFVLAFLLYAATTSAADNVLKAVLYNYATGRDLPSDLDQDTLAAAFAYKGE